MSSVRVQVGDYAVQLWRGREPASLDALKQGAELAESHGPAEHGEFFAVSVAEHGAGSSAPALLVCQYFSPSVPGFEPGLLIVPETGVAFIGAGERLLAYDLKRPARLWQDRADAGFWWWDRSGDVVLMAAELELAAWNTSGRKLWSTFVEPPWFYRVEGETLHLDVMDFGRSFPLRSGPADSVQPV
ncbi:hypothetical protein DKM44_03590 [Deinococcus irradiatisoli]|uniref:Uncharacterized protein n=1 Tax=Deinococcus irradiatisoli TaxID=2202254 RepID=A0A2Z3JGF6_9DEIO|nr:hypothetical protein [Deinococcus irradiatisoli]AWN22430.1 hypothetical protein DKM44_03590 [Deinococcus irradiatisoli]